MVGPNPVDINLGDILHASLAFILSNLDFQVGSIVVFHPFHKEAWGRHTKDSDSLNFHGHVFILNLIKLYDLSK